MELTIDITKNIKEQFDHYFKLEERDGNFYPHPSIGNGKGMTYLDFPGQMEFYHFKETTFKMPIIMTSINPKKSKWLLIHINLSKTRQLKKIGDEQIEFQKHLPIGILLYGPDLEIVTPQPIGIELELASLRFSHHFLNSYFDDWKSIIDLSRNIVYEDLDHQLENAIYDALAKMDNKISCHSSVLRFMDLFLRKLSKHIHTSNHHNLHFEDVKSLFIAASHLRDPVAKDIPTLESLATFANMSKTKFKTSFKQLFGSAPIQYRNKIRMEYAREELISKRKTPSELSFELGYSHPSSFTSAFKKYFDELPSSV